MTHQVDPYDEYALDVACPGQLMSTRRKRSMLGENESRYWPDGRLVCPCDRPYCGNSTANVTRAGQKQSRRVP